MGLLARAIGRLVVLLAQAMAALTRFCAEIIVYAAEVALRGPARVRYVASWRRRWRADRVVGAERAEARRIDSTWRGCAASSSIQKASSSKLRRSRAPGCRTTPPFMLSSPLGKLPPEATELRNNADCSLDRCKRKGLTQSG